MILYVAYALILLLIVNNVLQVISYMEMLVWLHAPVILIQVEIHVLIAILYVANAQIQLLIVNNVLQEIS